MRKISLVVTLIAIILLNGCTEKGPAIDFGGHITSQDTTYMAPVETAQAHNVLVENFTGVTCPNCPIAHNNLNNIIAQNTGRIIPVALHIYNFPQATPSAENQYDFRDSAATDIASIIYTGVSAEPVAGIDRVINPSPNIGPLLFESALWANIIGNRLAYASPVKLTLMSTFDGVNAQATLKVRIAYTQAVNGKQNLNIAVVEDNIVDAQEYPDSTDHHYVFTDIMRGLITPIYGSPIVDSIAVKTAGRVVERTFTFPVKAAWKPENCRVVVFVTNNETGDKTVAQSAEIKLNGQ